MIDVVFLLLIYFIVTTHFSPGEGILTAKLPQDVGVHPEDVVPEKPLVIQVRETPGGAIGCQIEILGQLMDDRSLKNHLKEGRELGLYGDKTMVVLKSGPGVRWQFVVQAFNTLIASEMRDISLTAI